MLNCLCDFIRKENMIAPSDTVICAVSGGADSMALLWGLYLLREKLDFRLEAAHFNHHLRQEASDRDAAFVAQFCSRFEIPLHLGEAWVEKGEKGLEAAAREARYAFFRSLPGIIATAHTADDNAETVLLHLVRGTGLKGLGAICPVGDRLIRPMLNITRAQVLAFLEEYHIPHVEDGSNETDDFLRNRIRHSVMPVLLQENPRLAENLSAMAQRLRLDAACLESMTQEAYTTEISRLRTLEKPVLSRVLEKFLKENGVKEPTARHIALAESLVHSDNPSARGAFPGGVTVARAYDRLTVLGESKPLAEQKIACPGVTELPELGLRLICRPAQAILQSKDVFTVQTCGELILRSRLPGDAIRLSGGTKSLKKRFIDAKIPEAQRLQIPVICDAQGIVGVYGFGTHEERKAHSLPAVQLVFEKTEGRT